MNLAQSRIQNFCRLGALTGHLGVESRGKITATPSMDAHEHIGTLGIHLGFLQYTQPWKNYQNVISKQVS